VEVVPVEHPTNTAGIKATVHKAIVLRMA